jgi:transposase IS66 family protein
MAISLPLPTGLSLDAASWEQTPLVVRQGVIHLLAQYRQRRDEVGALARTLEREMGSLWTFVVEDGVEPTNNRAEKALRFAVLWRKLMQGTHNEKGDRWVERMLSWRETCRLRGMPTFPVSIGWAHMPRTGASSTVA